VQSRWKLSAINLISFGAQISRGYGFPSRAAMLVELEISMIMLIMIRNKYDSGRLLYINFSPMI